jgi:glycosyltransferase involved in cell wall biosynthesis
MAHGEIVAWINSDDLYMPGAIVEAVEALSAHPEAGMVYADGVLVDDEGRILDWHRYQRYSALDLLCFEVLLQPTVFTRRAVLEEVGILKEAYNLILDHDLWLRIAARYPIIHVPSFWAVERTHSSAKTMAAAADFVDEGYRMLELAKSDSYLKPICEANQPLIDASMETFAARRLIDSRQYHEALRHFGKSLGIRPGVALRFWYKMLQAAMGAVGLESLFLWYRRTRRHLQHGSARIDISGERQ